MNDIIVISEAWLHDSMHNSKLFPSSYNIVGAERKFDCVDKMRSGGVLLALNNSKTYKILDISHLYNVAPQKDICAYISFNFYIVVVYIPPDDIPNFDYELFVNALEVTILR